MIYQLPEIVEMVRTALRRGKTPRPLLRCRDPDNMPLDEMIVSKIGQGAIRAYLEAEPVRLLEARRDFSSSGVYWHEPVDGTWSGHVGLPGDFLRLCVFGMSDWATPVFEAVSCRSARFALTRSRYSALRGCPERPMVAISEMPEGTVLEFYSCSSAAQTISHASYIPVPEIDEYGGMDIARSMIHEVVDSIAELVRNDEC